jgi:hypothetical protein
VSVLAEPTPSQRGPYAGRNARLSYEERLALRQAPRPLCKCGCGTQTRWLSKRARWAVYVDGHYRRPAPYKDEGWLRGRYIDQRRTQAEIAAECGVGPSVIGKFMRKFNIPARDRSESRMGRMVGPKNPSWKGGVADWDYAENWKVIARKIRNRDEWTCQMCGEQRSNWGRSLHVHHIDSNKLNNDFLNLISVCSVCHPKGQRAIELAPELRAIAARREGVME